MARIACLTVLALMVTVGSVAGQPNVRGQWTSVQTLPFFPVHVHLLPTGKVLIWSSYALGGDPRLWDPITGNVTTPAMPGYNLFCSGHSFLADGQLLVTGGHIGDVIGLPDANLYNAFTNTWTHLPNMNAGRWYPTTITLDNGDGLVVSGSIDQTLGVNRLPEVFQASSGTWRDLTNAQLALDLYPRMFLAPNSRVFNAGPSDVTRYLDTSGTGSWTAVATRNSGYRDYVPAVMDADGKVLFMGGGDPPTNAAEVIDLNQASPAWRTVASMSFARRQHNATLLPDGKVLITGGTSGPGFNNASTPVFAAEMWDPTSETWNMMDSAQIPRLYHSSALLLPDGRVLTAGGDGYPQTEVYSPPYLFKGARPTITSVQASVNYGQTIFVQTPDAASIAQVTWIRLGSVTHAFDMNQRINRLNFSQASGGLNVVTPSSGSLAPPGHYMLFIVNGNGVPSVASIIQIRATSVTDTTPPTVALTAPAAGATVSGTVTVSATASDNVGVVGVQFLLDGNPLDAEDTTAPYSISWNTTSTANGPHQLSARARDAAGNTAQATAVTVTVSNTAATAGLIAAYALDEGSGTLATDASGSGYHGSLVNGPTWVPGHTGSALSFDGVNDYVSNATLPYLPQWTISAWVRSPAAPSGTGYGGPIQRETNFQITWNHVSAAFRGAAVVNVGGAWFAASHGPLAANTWYHLAATYDGETLRAYTNGALVTSDASPSGPATPEASPLRLGAHAIVANFFQGLIDDVRIYNRALSLTEVQQTMQTPVGGTPPPPPPDTTPPTVALSAPAAGTTVSGTVTVSATASDNVGVAGVQFLLDGNPLGAEDTTAPYSISWNTTTVTPGDHVLTARARDGAGNTATSAAVSVTVTAPPAPDTTLPTVALTAPAAGATVSGTVTVSATASDNVGVVGVQFLLDGNPLDAEDTTAPYSISWNTTTASNGTHQLSAQARDAAGNTAQATAVSVTVSNTAATAGLIAAYAFDEGSGTLATDASGSGYHGSLVNGPTWVAGHTGSALSFDGVNDYVSNATLPYLPQWTISAWVRSPAAPSGTGYGGPIQRETNFQITWNHVSAAFRGAAVVNVNGAWFAASHGPLAANTWYHLAATYDGETLRAYTNGALVTSDASPSGPATPEASPLRLGAHAIVANFFQGLIDDVRIYNRALSLSEVQQTMQTPVGGTPPPPPPPPDATPPTVALSAPAGGATVSGTVAVSATASDNVGVAGVQFLLDGNPLGAEDTTAPYSISWNTTTVTPGDHVLTARARDGAGNTATSAAVSVTVTAPPAPDTTLPTVALTAPAAGATVSGTVTVSATASDNVGVVGVQFLLDGNPLDAEDTTAPYSISWNTTTASNGTHQLSAQARDAAGNTAQATAVSVTVSNAAAAGPIAAYALDEGSGTLAIDASGSGYHGSLVNGPTWVAGHTGSALSFDGVNDYVSNATLPYLPQWTISAWVRSPARPSGAAASGPIHRGTNFQITWNHPSAASRGAAVVHVGGSSYAARFGALAANTWHYLAATYDGETLRAYKNGVLVNSNANPSGPATAEASPIRLGGHATLPQFFQGVIDDVRIYNRALSLTEVQQTMQTPVGP